MHLLPGSLGRALLFGLLVLSGCVHPLRRNYARTFNCPVEGTRIQKAGWGRARVSGCAGEATYVCLPGGYGNRCVISESPSYATPAPASIEASGSGSPYGYVKRGKGSDDTPVIALDLFVNPTTTLALRAAPIRYPDAVRVELSRARKRGDSVADCQLMMMANGQRMGIAETKTVSDGKTGRDVLRVIFSRQTALELAGVQQMAIKVCEQRWQFNAEQLGLLREFAQAMQEEIAWSSEKGEKSLALPAPAGGWAGWNEGVSAAVGSTQEALAADRLFALVAPSVHQVAAETASGGAQGSAVAVDEHVLITNCHVVAGATKIRVMSGETAYAANLVRADPGSDRCVLEVPELKLEPVRGMRGFDALKVGEVAYTIGTPRGLEKTLGSGLVSGLREIDGQRYVQTSAPVSSGSSGGGLFDAYGNLIGITTWVRADASGVTQGLNFAIPADRYLKPRT